MKDHLSSNLVAELRALCNSSAGNYDLRRKAGAAADEIDRLTAIVERDKTSAVHRLHNICDALTEQKGESPFSSAAWQLADEVAAETGNENLRLKARVAELEVRLMPLPSWKDENALLRASLERIVELADSRERLNYGIAYDIAREALRAADETSAIREGNK